MTAAAIDIGTNSILLLVADYSPEQGLRPLVDRAKTVRLGEGLGRSSQLQPDAIARTLAGLADYATVLEQYSPDTVLCFATEAVRRSHNRELFCQQVRERFGWNIRILSPEEEARYTFSGVCSSLPTLAEPCWVVDIGGGSTEVIYGRDSAITYQNSFTVGAVTLQERFSLAGCISPKQLARVEQQLHSIFADILPATGPVLLSGGTATTLAALEQRLTTYDIQKIDGYPLTAARIDDLYDRLNRLSLEERRQLPGMEAGRADIILAALVILQTLIKQLATDRLRVTVRGARYGLLLALAENRPS